MKKHIYLFAIFIISIQSAVAQYVTIPDAQFRAILKRECIDNKLLLSCFNEADQIDSNCSIFTYSKNLNASGCNISNLDGIQYFKNLESLICHSNKLISLPSLPNKITYLSCSGNQLKFLTSLPDSLKYLYCYNNQLVNLPRLPKNLSYLHCYDNQLGDLPELPKSLVSLFCSNNRLIDLPVLPDSLWALNCSLNQLISLPKLPKGLKDLSASLNCFGTLFENPNPSVLKVFSIAPNRKDCK